MNTAVDRVRQGKLRDVNLRFGPTFGSLAALNDWLADQCVRLWQQTPHPELDMTIWEASLERPHLGPSTGKTHLGTSIGVQAVEHHHRRVRLFSTVELVSALEVEKVSGKPGHLATRLMYADLNILDELGIRPSARPAVHCCPH